MNQYICLILGVRFQVWSLVLSKGNRTHAEEMGWNILLWGKGWGMCNMVISTGMGHVFVRAWKKKCFQIFKCRCNGWLVTMSTGQTRHHVSTLTHLCLTFHYWNSSNVVVIYILRKVIAESDFSPMSASQQGTCYLVVHRVSHCCRYWPAGSLSKSDENFSEDFFTTSQ